MFFKKVVMILFSLSFLGCNLRLKEDPPKPKPISFKSGQSECLANVLPVAQNFMKGDATKQEVGAVWECFAGAIELFAENTQGSNENFYKPREVANFFETYFLDKNTKISNDFLTEIMRFKQLFVGGDFDKISRVDLAHLADFARSMKNISEDLAPYMKVYAMKWGVQGYRTLSNDVQFFEKANDQIQVAAKDIATLIAANGKGYELKYFPAFLHQLEILDGTSWDIVADIEKYMPLIQKLKQTLTGGDPSVVGAQQWRQFALLGSRGYIQYLRYYYFIKTPRRGLIGGTNLVYIARSVDDLFSYLADLVSEKPGQHFTRSELLELLQAFSEFFPSVKVREELLVEVMKIKRLFFGGSDQEWTPRDFEYARSKVTSLRFIFEGFLNYASVYGQSWRPDDEPLDQRWKYYNEAQDQLIQFGTGLGKLFDTDYDLNNIQKLASEIQKMNPQEPSRFNDWIQKYLPLVVDFKVLVLHQQGSLVYQKDWSELLQRFAQVYNQVLLYNYFIANNSMSSGVGLKGMDLLFQQTFTLFAELVKKSPDGLLSFVQLDSLVGNLVRSGLFVNGVTPETAQKMLHILAHRLWQTPERRLQGGVVFGLDSTGIQLMRQEIGFWVANQKKAEDVFSQTPSIPIQTLIQRWKSFSDPSLQEMLQVWDSFNPLIFDQSGILFQNDRPISYTWASFNQANLARSIIRLFFKSYISDLRRTSYDQGFTLDEAKLAFSELRMFFVEMGILDRDNQTFPSSRFREASLFTSRSDGNDLVSFAEGVDLVQMILSGVKLDADMRPWVIKECAVLRRQSTGDRMVSVHCMVNTYQKHLDFLMRGQPLFLNAMKNMSVDDQKSVLMNLMIATGYVEQDVSNILIKDAALAPHVMQYIESIMLRYDRGSGSRWMNGQLDTEEVLKAFPVYRKILQDIGGMTDEEDLQALFTYIMKHGEPPTKNLKGAIKFYWWKWHRSSWDVETTRADLARILAYISKATAKKSTIQLVHLPPESEIMPYLQ